MKRHIIPAVSGILTMGLAVASYQDNLPKSQKETTRIIRKVEDRYSRNISFGDALRNHYIMNSTDTTITNEWDFSFEGWQYVPFMEFSIRSSDTPENGTDRYIRNAIQKHRFMATNDDNVCVSRVLSDLGDITPSTALGEISDYVKGRMNRNNSFSTRPQSAESVLGMSGNCLDYSVTLAKIFNGYAAKTNQHIHAFPSSIYRSGENGDVGHAVVFLFDTETKRFTIEDIYSKEQIEAREVKVKRP